MNALRRARRFGRFLAAWLALSFVAMAAPAAPLRAPEAPADAHCTQAHDHGGSAAPTRPDAAHAGHSAGSASHCPLCVHAAAPAPPLLAQEFAGDAPADAPAMVRRVALRVRSAAPPPGRGPPLLS